MEKEDKKLPEVCNGCPTSKVAKFIGDFWMLLLVRELLGGPRRYTELKTALAGISTRTLSQKLEFAQSEDIIARIEYAEAPPRVEYSLTEKGRKLKGIVKEVEKYAADAGKSMME
jgi:DNA-binding HxlR family transcriptional regulator